MTTEKGLHTTKTLEDIGRRIEAHRQDWSKRGEFSNIYMAELKELDDRRARIQRRLAAAIQQNNTLEIIKLELQRDFSAVVDDLKNFMQRIEAGSMKAGK